jgi:nucleoside-diphosphate-sugar epimerase
MRLVITGASGFVGRALVAAAARSGHTGLVTGRTPPADVPTGWVSRSRDDVLGSEPQSPPADAIIHLEVRQAASQPGSVDPTELQQVNVEGTSAWLAWAGRAGIDRFVFVSSVLAVVRSGGPITETAALQTIEPYGVSKARAEVAVRAWADASPHRSAMILRPAPVYGPDRRANLVNFVHRVARGRPCLIGDGGARKSIVSRDNLVAAILHVAAREQPGCSVYNVADREGHTVAELADLVAELTGAPRPRSIPLWLARLAAPVADGVGWIVGRAAPTSSARVMAATNPGYFPCELLMETGFVHPQSTRDGLSVMLDGLGLRKETRSIGSSADHPREAPR